MTIVAGRTVIHRESVILFDNEQAELSFIVDNSPFTLRFSFVQAPEAGERTIFATADGAVLTWELRNWTETLGIALTAPIEVGRTAAGRSIKAALYHLRTDRANKLDLQFTVEA